MHQMTDAPYDHSTGSLDATPDPWHPDSQILDAAGLVGAGSRSDCLARHSSASEVRHCGPDDVNP
jgi:hypothetical protein